MTFYGIIINEADRNWASNKICSLEIGDKFDNESNNQCICRSLNV